MNRAMQNNIDGGEHFLINIFLLITMNTLTGLFSLVSALLLIILNFKNIRKQIIEEGGFKKWLNNFIKFKK
jgi:hypothetical protein